MNRVYFDNASTSFPKPKIVADRVMEYITENGRNIGRGGYESSYAALEEITAVREKVARLFGAEAGNVVFTSGATESMNLLLRGLLSPEDEVIISGLEHNSVVRPLVDIVSEKNIHIIPSDENGVMDVKQAEALLTSKVRALICIHASNVCGVINPIKELGEFCKKKELYFIVDGAQSAGLLDVDVSSFGIDAYTFAGHKTLYGIQGVGGVVLSDRFSKLLKPFKYGGTGSVSDLYTMPDFMPDKFEAGTLNIPGIISIGAGIDYINECRPDKILMRERELASLFVRGIKKKKGYRIIGGEDYSNKVSVVSIIKEGEDSSVIADILDNNGIEVRVGLHCAPLAHRTLHSFPHGTVRFSFSHLNTASEITKALSLL